ncbi:hypothetical protein J5N97_008536 [Dioscorea zingiberensis]|uniref:Uncharacterized protein n=1 Tax=Dioscorea zingiberensis TaxID=325984 RepID=A0A9D5HL45_9LILI|nr:hypothetical protein J5N97_008536 [Dioscorea zingiberensis]
MENHYISLSLDTGMLKGKTCMERFTIAKITGPILGIVDSKKVAEQMKKTVEENWTWTAAPLRDDGTLLRSVQVALDPLQQLVADGCHLTGETGKQISEVEPQYDTLIKCLPHHSSCWA